MADDGFERALPAGFPRAGLTVAALKELTWHTSHGQEQAEEEGTSDLDARWEALRLRRRREHGRGDRAPAGSPSPRWRR